MASFKQYTASGGASEAFSIKTFSSDEIKVRVDGVLKTATTHYNITSYTANGGTVTWTAGNVPTSGAVVRIYRITDVDPAQATYSTGASLKAGDLNDNQTQVLRGLEERNDQLVQTYNIEDSSITGTKIKNDAIDSQHYAATSIDTEHLANDAVTGVKIADNTVDSEHYAAGSIDTEHYATGSVTSSVINDGAVVASKLGTGAVTEAKIGDLQVTSGKIGADAINGTKIADNSIDSEHYVDGSIDNEHLADNAVDSAELKAGAVDLSHLSATGSKTSSTFLRGDNTWNTPTITLGANSVDSDNYVDYSIDTEHIAVGALDGRYYTEAELNAGQLDNRYYTETESDARYFNISSGDTIKDGETFPDNDTTIATTAAINDRIIDLIDDVGGFVPLANETSFPNANPDANNGAGTIISIKALASNLTSNGSGVATISNGTVGNSTVTINGLENSTTIGSGTGILVETTTTLNTYTFHRTIPSGTDVSTVAAKATEIGRLGTEAAVADLAILGTTDVVSDLDTVAGIAANVTTVAGIQANVTSVAGNAANINAVAADATDIGAVAGKATEIGRLGTAAAVEDLGILGTTAIVADMDALADIAGNITKVADVDANVTKVANIDGNVTKVADIDDKVTTVAGIDDKVTTVANNNSNVTTVANNNTNINTVAGISANVTTVAGISANVTSVANNATNINAVAADATDIGAVAGKADEIGRLGTAAAVEDLGILGTADVVNDMNILATADIVSDMNTLATSDVVADMNTLATSDVVSDMNTLATSANVTAMDNCSGSISNINTVSGSIANVNTTATNISNVNTVAGKATEIGRLGTTEAVEDLSILGTTAVVDDMALLATTACIADMALLGDSAVIADMATIADTSGLIANIATVAGNNANITTVAGISSDVTAVSGKTTEIGRLGTTAAVEDMALLGTAACVEDMSLLGTSAVVADMALLATTACIADMAIIADTSNLIANIGTVAGIQANVTTVAGISSNVTTVAGISSDVTAVANDATDIGAVAGKATEIGRLGTVAAVEDMALLGTNDCVADMALLGTSACVADMALLATTACIADMATIADTSGLIANIATVAGNNANVTNVGGSISNVNTVAGSIADVNRYANEYKIAASAPSSPSEGDLWYDDSNNILKYRSDSAWESISSGGITSVSADTSPTLGGHLNANSKNITSGGTFTATTFSGDLNGTINTATTATTQAASNNSTKVATTAYVDTAVAAVVDSAPGALNTLNELAAALGDDANYASTTATTIATKLPKSGGEMTGNITFSGSQTVDGRDLSADGSKLDGIAASANNYTHPNHSGEVTSTADGATVIADDVVDYANLKTSNDGSDGQFLKKNSGGTGGLTWDTVAQTDTTYSTSWVDSSNDAILRLTAGGSGSGTDDLKFVAGSNITLTPSGDNLTIAATDTNTWRGIDDTPVDGQTAESISSNWAYDHNAGTGNSKHVPAAGSSGQFLKHDGTWGTPPDTNTNILSGGTISGTTYFPDNTSLYWGAGNDLRIRHNSSDHASYITESGAGHLYINADDFQIWNTAGNEVKATFVTDGGVELRYNNHPTFSTRSDGVQMKAPTGDALSLYLAADNWTHYTDAWRLTSHTDGVFRIANHVASGTYEAAIDAVANADVKLYYNGSNKLQTSSTGVTVTGTCTATAFAGDGSNLTGLPASVGGSTGVDFNDTVKARWGTGNDLEIFHDGNDYIKSVGTGNLYIDCTTGDLQIRGTGFSVMANFVDDGTVELYHDGSKKFETTSGGATVTGTCTATTFSGSGASLTNIPADSTKLSLTAGSGTPLTGTLHCNATNGEAISVPDNQGIWIGTGNDIKISHNGSNSFFENLTGYLEFQGASNEKWITMNQNGSVDIYYDNTKKFETTSYGGHLTGEWRIEGGDLFLDDDSYKLKIGEHSDITMYHDNGHGYLDNITGKFTINGNNGNGSQRKAIVINPAAGTEIYYDNDKKAETVSGGFTVTGTCTATSFAGDGSNLTGISAGVTSDSNQNTVAGTNAGDSFTGNDATKNSVYGYDAGTAITTGDENVAIGNNCGSKITTGSQNVVIGSDCAENLISGDKNSIIGSYAFADGTGSQNSALGQNALRYAKGADNVGVGYKAGFGASGGAATGDDNVAIGVEALAAYTSGEGNTCVGYKAGDAITSGTSNVTIGKDAGGALTTGHAIVAIGDAALFSLTTVGNATGVGHTAGQYQTGVHNTWVGYKAGKGTSGSSTGTYNTAVGSQAGEDLTTGQSGTFIGYSAGKNVTTGSQNCAIGANALETCTTGADNIAYGTSSLGQTTGSQNVAIGKNSGYDITSGSNNIVIGYDADVSSASVDNEITLGNSSITKFRIPGLNFVVKDSTATEDHVLTVDANGEASWEAAGGGAVADGCIYENSQTISNNYTMTTNKNGISAGPITVSATVTIPSGSTWSIV